MISFIFYTQTHTHAHTCMHTLPTTQFRNETFPVTANSFPLGSVSTAPPYARPVGVFWILSSLQCLESPQGLEGMLQGFTAPWNIFLLSLQSLAVNLGPTSIYCKLRLPVLAHLLGHSVPIWGPWICSGKLRVCAVISSPQKCGTLGASSCSSAKSSDFWPLC